MPKLPNISTEQLPLPAWITFGQASRLLGKTYQAIYSRISAGILTPRLVLGTKMVSTKAILAILDEERTKLRRGRQ